MSDEPGYFKALRDFVKAEPEDSPLGESTRELFGSNDRATVLMLGAMLDASLEKLLLTILRSQDDLTKKEQKSIFGTDNGVFGNFSSKITAAYALKLIGTDCKHDLDLIRFLRNQFAHCRRAINFSIPEVKNACMHLKMAQEFFPIDYFEVAREQKLNLELAGDWRNNPRSRFVCVSYNLAYRMFLARGNDDIIMGPELLGDTLLP